jgi:SAM-dependent methyltransferase
MATAQTVQTRSRNLRNSLAPLATIIEDSDVLDFGGESLSMLPLYELGAWRVTATQPDAQRVTESNKTLIRHGYAPTVIQTGYEPRIPFGDACFDTVIANAVLEHIPQPRDEYIRELWRVLKSGGHLIINETPNKYFPIDVHTTKLWFVPWLPSRIAHWYAGKRDRLHYVNDPWPACGWRGLGYFEMVAPISDYTLIPENTSTRHRVFTRLGIPASIIDPYPLWVLRKH